MFSNLFRNSRPRNKNWTGFDLVYDKKRKGQDSTLCKTPEAPNEMLQRIDSRAKVEGKENIITWIKITLILQILKILNNSVCQKLYLPSKYIENISKVKWDMFLISTKYIFCNLRKINSSFILLNFLIETNLKDKSHSHFEDILF